MLFILPLALWSHFQTLLRPAFPFSATRGETPRSAAHHSCAWSSVGFTGRAFRGACGEDWAPGRSPQPLQGDPPSPLCRPLSVARRDREVGVYRGMLEEEKQVNRHLKPFWPFPLVLFFFPAMMWRLSFTCRAHPVLQGGPAGVVRAHTSAPWLCRPGPCRGGTWNVSWKSHRRLAVPGSGLVNAGAQAPARATAVRRQLSALTFIRQMFRE